jgi:hypothetical protein
LAEREPPRIALPLALAAVDLEYLAAVLQRQRERRLAARDDGVGTLAAAGPIVQGDLVTQAQALFLVSGDTRATLGIHIGEHHPPPRMHQVHAAFASSASRFVLADVGALTLGTDQHRFNIQFYPGSFGVTGLPGPRPGVRDFVSLSG